MPYGVCDECWSGHHENCTGCPCKASPVAGAVPRFREGDTVTVVECDFSTGKPLKDGETHDGTVVYADLIRTDVRFGRDLGAPLGRCDVFWNATGWRMNSDDHDWRLMPAIDQRPAS